MQQLISIIVAVYNGESYLDRCISSILKQSYPNIELILVNDGSTDSSLQICQKWQEADKRVKLIDKPNGGCYTAWNAGLDMANGSYYTFVDQDDFVHPEIYQSTINIIEKSNVDIVTYGRIRFSTHLPDFRKITDCNYLSMLMTGKEALSHLFRKTKLIKPAVWDKVYRSYLFDNLRFPNTFFEDAALTYQLLYKARDVQVTNYPLYGYFIHPGSMITTPWNREKLNSFYDINNAIDDFCSKNKEKKILLDSYIWRLNFGIEAWCRCQKSDVILEQEKKDILRYMRSLMSFSNLYGMNVSLKRKIKYFLFTYFPHTIVRFLKINFDNELAII